MQKLIVKRLYLSLPLALGKDFVWDIIEEYCSYLSTARKRRLSHYKLAKLLFVFLHPSPTTSPPIFLLSPVFSFELVQHGARNQIGLIEFSAFSQDQELRRTDLWTLVRLNIQTINSPVSRSSCNSRISLS